jgi:RimK family alpha-L-glutamate ligase
MPTRAVRRVWPTRRSKPPRTRARNGARFVFVGAASPTTTALVDALRRLGTPAEIAAVHDVGAIGQPGEVFVGRIGGAPPDGETEAVLDSLRELERGGTRVLNGTATLLVCRDKLATARCLAGAGIPHPRTALLDARAQAAFEPPLVVKPRFGDAGDDIHLCVDADELQTAVASLARRSRPRSRDAIVQELVPTGGQDLRVVVAGGCVVGGLRRIAPRDSWRTSDSGGSRHPVAVSPRTAALACAVADAVRGDLVGVDLAVFWNGQTVLDVDSGVEFTAEYSPHSDPFERAAAALIDAAARRAAAN